MATFGFAIVLFAFITSQVVDPCITRLLDKGVDKLGNCRDQLMDKNVLIKVDGTRLESNVEELQKASTVLVTGFGRTASFPQMWFLTLAYFVFAPLAFFGTLGTAHGPMRDIKLRDLRRLSNRFNAEYRYVHDNLQGEAKEINDGFARVEQVHKLHRLTDEFPVWPWDLGSIRRFVSAVIGFPLISSVLGAVAIELGRRILV